MNDDNISKQLQGQKLQFHPLQNENWYGNYTEVETQYVKSGYNEYDK